MTRCGCGCGADVPRKWGRQRKFLNRAHYARAAAGPAYAEFRHRRSVAAGQAAATARRARAIARAARFRNKRAAYATGYRVGYNRATRWWRERYQRLYYQRYGHQRRAA